MEHEILSWPLELDDEGDQHAFLIASFYSKTSNSENTLNIFPSELKTLLHLMFIYGGLSISSHCAIEFQTKMELNDKEK